MREQKLEASKAKPAVVLHDVQTVSLNGEISFTCSTQPNLVMHVQRFLKKCPVCGQSKPLIGR